MDPIIKSIIQLGEPCVHLIYEDIEHVLSTSKNDSLQCIREKIGFVGGDKSAYSNCMNKLINQWLIKENCTISHKGSCLKHMDHN